MNFNLVREGASSYIRQSRSRDNQVNLKNDCQTKSNFLVSSNKKQDNVFYSHRLETKYEKVIRKVGLKEECIYGKNYPAGIYCNNA